MICRLCEKHLAAHVIGLCAQCLREGKEGDRVVRAHAATREEFGLPQSIPDDSNGKFCRLCANACRIGPGRRGFCGLRENARGKLVSRAGTPQIGCVQWYYDPLPTNCVAGWVCPEGETALAKAQPGRRPWQRPSNLAVFYEACTFDCLFCQNWSYRAAQKAPHEMTARELAGCAGETTACICFFGGDPAAQMPHALRTAEIALERRAGAIRICWETNGSMNPALARRAAQLSLLSGGCVKFDLKTFDETLHRALTGASNRQTLENFRMIAEMGKERPDPPPLIASTLLVPGYVDDAEIAALARFVAAAGPEIPYSLLGFHPDFCFFDLPTTSRAHADRALSICREAGLRRVHVGNRHILGSADY